MRIPDWLLHAMILTALGAAITTYVDVQLIKARLDYYHGPAAH